MAATPRYKVHDREGLYQASCKEPEAAAALCWFYNKGSTIRVAGRIVYRNDGALDQDDSYDAAAEKIMAAEAAVQRAAYLKAGGHLV